MYKNILIATDGSELADKAVSQGLALAKAVGAKATVVTITEPWTAVAPMEVGVAFPVDAYEEGASAQAKRILEKVDAQAKAAGLTCDVRHVRDQMPAEGIIGAAEEIGADLIVMASHGRRGLKRLILGSQANSVVTHSHVPILICR